MTELNSEALRLILDDCIAFTERAEAAEAQLAQARELLQAIEQRRDWLLMNRIRAFLAQGEK